MKFIKNYLPFRLYGNQTEIGEYIRKILNLLKGQYIVSFDTGYIYVTLKGKVLVKYVGKADLKDNFVWKQS